MASYLDIIAAIWLQVVVGTVLALGGVGVGWVVGRGTHSVGVRVIAWWLTRLIVPRLRSASWSVRAGIIFANNTIVLAVVVASGVDKLVAVIAIALLGVSLGIALRVLIQQEDRFTAPSRLADKHAHWQMRIGVALNMLEPPAILLAMGLGLAQSWSPLAATDVWRMYVVVCVPLLLIAAAGEAMWLGTCGHQHEPRDAIHQASHNHEG